MPSIKSQLKNWHKVRLGEIADVLPGFAFKSSEFRKDSGIPVIKIKNITDNYNVSIDDSEYLDESVLNEKTKKYLVSFGDILVAMTGATAGKVGKFRLHLQALLNQRVAKIIPQKVNQDFLWILLGNQDTVGMLYRLADGAAQPNMSGGQIENMEFIIPKSESEQGRIADVIVAYDDLIENNTKRIKILEEIAQAIYREWFVYFRFPRLRQGFGGQAGHEKVKMIDSKTEFGKIPDGWKIRKIKDIFDVKYGKNLPTSKIQASGDYSVYGAGGVIGFYNEQNSNGKVALVTCRGNGSGTVWRTRGLGFVTNNSFTVRPKEEYKYIDFTTVYFALKSANVDSAISGSAQPQITIESLNFVNVLLPEEGLIKSFQEVVKFHFDLIDSLFVENQNLRQARDLLLPKLVTGEVGVR